MSESRTKRVGINQVVDEFNRTVPRGRMVDVVEDDGRITRTHIRSKAWITGDKALVMLEDRLGGYDLSRIRI